MKLTDLLQLVDNLQQAGKIHKFHNLQAGLWHLWLCMCYAHINGKSVNNNHYCCRQKSKSVSHDSEKIWRIWAMDITFNMTLN